MQFEQIAILGPGLIGGSVALAVRRYAAGGRLVLWSRDDAERAEATRREIADLVTDDPAAAVRDADLVLLCVPPGALVPLGALITPYLRPGALVSDVASVKAGIVEELTALFQRPDGSGGRFVGAHPMAGGERHGLAAARDDLFGQSLCLLTPIERTDPAAVAAVSGFWRQLGASVRQMSPEAHDEAMAFVSHLPHLVAAALAGLPATEAADCAGPGWRGMTRLAEGSPELWTEILSHNRAPVTYALRSLISRMGEALELLEPGREADLRHFLADARGRRRTLRTGP